MATRPFATSAFLKFYVAVQADDVIAAVEPRSELVSESSCGLGDILSHRADQVGRELEPVGVGAPKAGGVRRGQLVQTGERPAEPAVGGAGVRGVGYGSPAHQFHEQVQPCRIAKGAGGAAGRGRPAQCTDQRVTRAGCELLSGVALGVRDGPTEVVEAATSPLSPARRTRAAPWTRPGRARRARVPGRRARGGRDLPVVRERPEDGRELPVVDDRS